MNNSKVENSSSLNIARRQNSGKMRQRSFSNSDVEKENPSIDLINLCGAIKECDTSNIDDSFGCHVNDIQSPNQRRGSTPSKFPSDTIKRLSPPVVRVNSPQNNEDLDAVEKQLGDMLEATIASIESGIPFKSQDSYVRGGQIANTDDEDSPLSFFTGSFNYFFKPQKRYSNNSYHQPAQYSSWSSDISSTDQLEKSTNFRRRQSLRDIGRTQSLDPPLNTRPENNQHSYATRLGFPGEYLSGTESSGFDTEDQIDEYMMLLHSNPELFLASVRKNGGSFETQQEQNTERTSTKRQLKRKPSIKDLGRAQTLEPSWTPESSTREDIYTRGNCNDEFHKPHDHNRDVTPYYYKDHHAYVRKTKSVPETKEVFCDDLSTTRNNNVLAPTIIVTPPSQRPYGNFEFNAIAPSSIYHRKLRSKSLALNIARETISSNEEESIKLRKFLSQGNLIRKNVGEARELPSQKLFENGENRRYTDR